MAYQMMSSRILLCTAKITRSINSCGILLLNNVIIMDIDSVLECSVMCAIQKARSHAVCIKAKLNTFLNTNFMIKTIMITLILGSE